MKHGGALVAMVTAINDADRSAISAACRELEQLMGRDSMIDAVAVYANFSMMTRIADGTGTPLDRGTAAMSQSLRSGLELDELESARL